MMLITFLINLFSCTFSSNDQKNEELPLNIESKVDTTIRSYYSDGSVKSEARYVNGKKFGTTLTYYPNGEPNSCYFYNADGKLIYKVNFNEDGSYNFSEGKPTFFLFINQSDTLLKGEPIKFSVLTPKVPKSNVKLFIGEKREDSLAVQSEYIVRNNIPFFSYSFEEPGEHNFFIVTIIRQDGIIIENDTTWLKPYVL